MVRVIINNLGYTDSCSMELELIRRGRWETVVNLLQLKKAIF